MANYFLKGLRRIFSVKRKPKRKLAPYGSIARPKIVLEYPRGEVKGSNKVLVEDVKSMKKKTTKSSRTKSLASPLKKGPKKITKKPKKKVKK